MMEPVMEPNAEKFETHRPPLRVAIVGLGRAALHDHLPALTSLPDLYQVTVDYLLSPDHENVPEAPAQAKRKHWNLALMLLSSVRSPYLYHRLLHHNNTLLPYSHSFNNSFCDHMLTYTGFLYNTTLSLSFNLVIMSYLFSYPMFILNSGSMPFNNYT